MSTKALNIYEKRLDLTHVQDVRKNPTFYMK